MTAETNLFAHASFLMSAARLAQLPQDDIGEIAFAGRSNAGKSSALNKLCGIRALARVSKTPGRTQLINLFTLQTPTRLADLPGYGFAQVPEAIRRQWGALVGGYIETRENLSGLVVMMDVRHPLTPLDRQMLDWSHSHQRPVHILLTKADKLGRGAAGNALAGVRKDLKAYGESVTAQLFSALKGTGIDEARATIAERFGVTSALQSDSDSSVP
ncbi:MAG: ribosome biogenesis GTP-binding protein YihA/YsxC [Acetobacteraceae bacterium]